MDVKRVLVPGLVLLGGMTIGYFLGQAKDQTGARLSAQTEPAPSEAQVQPKPAAAEDTTHAVQAQPPPPRAVHGGMNSVMETMSLVTDFAQTEALYAMAGRANVATVKRYIDEAIGIDIEMERAAVLQILYLRFSELDPAGSLTHVYEMNLSKQFNILYVMFSAWAKYDLEGAIERIGLVKGNAERELAQQAILQAHAHESLAVVAQIAAQLPGSASGRDQVIRLLASKARSQPESAIAEALTLKNFNDRTRAVQWIANLWAKEDPDRALAYSARIENRRHRDEFRRAVLGQMIQKDPEKGFRMLDGSNNQEQQTIMNYAVSALVQSDPQNALALAANVENAQLRQQALGSVMVNWANQDPRGAAKALEGMSGLALNLRRQFGYNIGREYAQIAPEEALAWAERVEGHRGDLWQRTVGVVAQENPAAALALALTMDPSPHQAALLSNVLGKIAGTDPSLATQYLGDVPEGGLKDQAISQIANHWAQLDPIAALEWILTQSPQSQEYALSSIAYQLASSDAELAASYTDQVSGPAQEQWISSLSKAYSQQNPQQAAKWVLQFEDSPQFGQWVGTVAGGLAAKDPRAGIRLLSKVDDDQHYQTAQLQFVQDWSRFDPKAAARWWQLLPSQKKNVDAIDGLVQQWQLYDRMAAKKWVMRLKMSDHKDQGLLVLLGTGDLSDAEDLIAKIQSDHDRQQAYVSLFHSVYEYDIDAARDLIDRAQLTPEQRESLEQMLEGQTRVIH